MERDAAAGSETVLVTGGGSGIGREFVRLFLADGAWVLVVSLVQDELDDLKRELGVYGDRLFTLQRDLSRAGAARELAEWCDANGWRIDTLVNNAGFATYSEVVDEDLDRVEAMIRLNVIGVTQLSALFGDRMKTQGRGDILNVGSTAGMVASGRFAAYGGTKAYVNLFTAALRAELKPYGVNVTLLAPGAASSKFAQAAGVDTFSGKSMMKDLFASGKSSSPADVAKAGYRAMRKGKPCAIVGKGAGFARVGRLLPQHLLPSLVKDA